VVVIERTLLALFLLVLPVWQPTAPVQRPARSAAISKAGDEFLEDLSKRSFMFFWEQADAGTGIVRDRSKTTGEVARETAREIGSIASVGFGLSGLCIAADRGWLPRSQVIDRARVTLRFFAERMPQEHGWYFHFVNLRTGAREWQSELSSIDTALLLGGVLTVRRCSIPIPTSSVSATRSIGASTFSGCWPAIRWSCRTAGNQSWGSCRDDGITTAS
jgi:hypothetical protein